jgi:hypothetical protein
MKKTAMSAFNKLAEARAKAFLKFADAIDAMAPALSDDDKRRLMGDKGRIMFNLSTFMQRVCAKTREGEGYRFRLLHHKEPWLFFGCSSTAQVRELMVRLQVAWADFVEITFIEPTDEERMTIAFTILFRAL